MSSKNWPIFQKGVIAHEGSKYTDGVNPYDPGGPTRYGITLATARQYWKKTATAEDIKTLSLSVALSIYKARYWDAVRGDDLPGGVDYSTGDYGVNSGIGRAGKVLRRLVSLPDNTSVIDATVLAAVAKRDPAALVKAMNAERLRFMQSLAIWPTYKNGWTRRVKEVTALSLTLAAANATLAPATPPAPAEMNSSDMGKATVPEPTAAKNTVKVGVPAATGGAGGGFWDWVLAHPIETGVIVICVGFIMFAAIKVINARWRARQEAPTPGLVPVPELEAKA